MTLAAGDSRHELTLALDHPRLWWPVGHGEQSLYTVEVVLETGGETQAAVRKTGVRRVEMDQSPHPVTGRHCILKINGRPIFCKGGNWVPPDLLYSTVTKERHWELVDLALAANFNLLRIWGGGLYMDHEFCEMCDEAGVLLWHDCIFACIKYPGDDRDFLHEVRREITFVVRELAHHPSLVVWCGNNEIEAADWHWGWDKTGRADTHHAIFHREIPRIVKKEDPSTLHWISSPWSPDLLPPTARRPEISIPGPSPSSPVRPTGGPIAATWIASPTKAASSGPASPATLRQFMPGEECALRSLAWDHHDNYFTLADSQHGGPRPRLCDRGILDRPRARSPWSGRTTPS